jgi:hypothetical protein
MASSPICTIIGPSIVPAAFRVGVTSSSQWIPLCRMAAPGSWPGRGKSGLPEATVPGNARAGQPDGQRHREQTAPGAPGVRVKRWGKSPPRDGQPDRHGKPHREQCRIGAPRGRVRRAASTQGPGLAARSRRRRRDQRNGHPGVRAPDRIRSVSRRGRTSPSPSLLPQTGR